MFALIMLIPRVRHWEAALVHPLSSAEHCRQAQTIDKHTEAFICGSVKWHMIVFLSNHLKLDIC